ncbi:zinc finger, CCHC-type containing protein [Tanacetum coccineum]
MRIAVADGACVNLRSNILSLGQLTESGCEVVMEKNILLLYDSNGNILLRVTRSKNRLYKANLRIGEPTCLLANLRDEAWLWHARLGHLNFRSLKSMTTKNLVQGIPPIKHSTDICDICLIGKHSRAPFPQQAKYRSKTALDLIYGDLCGPISPPTPSGKRYIFLLVDDYSRYMWEYFLNSKDQAFDVFKEFKTRVEKEHGTKIKMFRTDRGREFTSNEFHKYCRENRIIRQLTAPYSLQQKGVVERKNRTILSTTRCMMKATGMPQNFWAEAVRHAILLLNCTPTKSLEDVTPYEALKGRKINLQHIRIFRCIAYAKVPSQHLTKLDDRSIQMVYLGSEPGSKAYRLFDPITKKICASRDVRFKEDETWNWEEYVKDFDPKEPEWIARIETIRLILALAAYNKWEVHHLDVKSAFLHGDLKEEVYVSQPDGFIKTEDKGKVYRLRKALYGLRQAPRAWYTKLDKTLKLLNFKKCALEQAVYTRTDKTSTLLIGVYLYDLKSIEVTQKWGEISIKQTGYATKILKDTGMLDCNDAKIPMEPGLKLTKLSKEKFVDPTEYRSIIGCLRYLLHTRPDLRTKDYGITYGHDGNKIQGYSDNIMGVKTQEGKAQQNKFIAATAIATIKHLVNKGF